MISEQKVLELNSEFTCEMFGPCKMILLKRMPQVYGRLFEKRIVRISPIPSHKTDAR